MQRGLKIRIYPNQQQIDQLTHCFGCARFVWNEALSFKNEMYKKCNVSISTTKLINRITFLKNEYPFLRDVPSQLLQQSLLNLDKAFERFFKKKSKFPRFKKQKYGKQSFRLPQGFKVDTEVNKISLPKIGWIKAKIHRPIEGTVKSITISRDTLGHYYASLLVDDGKIEPETTLSTNNMIGLDLGLMDLLITSDGFKVKNPRLLQKSSSKIRRAQHRLSKTARTSKRRAKARRRVAKIHKKIANVRNDLQHKLSKKLCDENQVIGVETLKVKNMLKNRKLSKAISDISWSSFLVKLGYKLASTGGKLVKVGKFFPSSKTCNCCGHKLDSLSLSVRTWVCPNCNVTHDRDINAAINIRKEALKIFTTADGSTVAARGGKRKIVRRTTAAVEPRSPVL